MPNISRQLRTLLSPVKLATEFHYSEQGMGRWNIFGNARTKTSQNSWTLKLRVCFLMKYINTYVCRHKRNKVKINVIHVENAAKTSEESNHKKVCICPFVSHSTLKRSFSKRVNVAYRSTFIILSISLKGYYGNNAARACSTWWIEKDWKED